LRYFDNCGAAPVDEKIFVQSGIGVDSVAVTWVVWGNGCTAVAGAPRGDRRLGRRRSGGDADITPGDKPSPSVFLGFSKAAAE